MIPYFICLVPMLIIYTLDSRYRTDLKAWLALIFTGANFVNRALWFFPLILLFYLMTPISARIFRNQKLFLGVMFASMIVALLVHRPTFVERLHHSFLYFLFPYFAGMALFRYELRILDFLKTGHRLVLLVLFLVISVQAAMGPELRTRRGYQTYRSFAEIDWRVWDLSAIQKTLIFLLLYFYLSNGDRTNRFFRHLNWYTPYCFGIHLYHGYCMSLYAYYFQPAPSKNVFWEFFPAWVGLWIATACFVFLVSKVLGRRSEYLFGH